MQPQHFRVTVRGTLGPRFAAAFDGVTVRSADGATTLSGVAQDQAQLYGVLERVADLGLELTELTTDDPAPSLAATAAPGAGRRPWRWAGFLVTFAAAWWMLDRFGSSPPRLVPASVAVVTAGAVLVAGSVALLGVRPGDLPRSLGLGRSPGRAIAVAAAAGLLAAAVPIGGALALGVDLTLRSDWAAVLLAVLVFHGIAEELVWRGFVFGYLRRRMSFGRALSASMPLIALTHVPIVVGSGWLVGGLAVLTAIATCLPFSLLWEQGRGTIWAPALLHASIDGWQVFERDYPSTFPVLVMGSAIVVAPLAVWLIGRRRDRGEG